VINKRRRHCRAVLFTVVIMSVSPAATQQAAVSSAESANASADVASCYCCICYLHQHIHLHRDVDVRKCTTRLAKRDDELEKVQ
jgi:hypothetical protein